MATSLSLQLQRLSGPQAVSLTDTRFKVSLLFESKEAATKDRRTIYELGLSGLQELIAINPNFQQFESTLFDENTINMERTVEHSEVNRLLDLNIEKFLHHIAPYFLLRPAHMCLEWLLRRFYIHEFNRNALIGLALPYHETNICVRVLQCIRIRSNDQEWGWLRRNKKSAVPVPKSSLIKHATTNVGFLSFVCNNTQQAIRELGPYAHHLQTQINFYASIAVGTLKNVTYVGEKYVVSLLPSLLQGFNSSSVDFVSAVYIIVSQLVSRTQLTAKLSKAFVKHVAHVSFEQLRPAAVLLLICIFDTQNTQPEISEATLLHLVSQKWLVEVLASLTANNLEVYPLCEPLLKGAVAAIHSKIEMETYKTFLESFLDNIKFPDTTAQKIINCILSSYIVSSGSSAGAKINEDDDEDDDVIALSSDDEEMATVDNNFQSWYSKFLQRLEHQYPNAFDATVKEALSSNKPENNNRSKAIKIVIGFRLKSFGQDATEMYESLYHHLSATRRYAMRTLLGNLDAYKTRPQNWPLLQECLNDRLRDDSEMVVQEVLRLSTQQFIDILGHDKFMAALFHILDHIHNKGANWTPLLPRVLAHMTAREVIQGYDNNLILLALMPLLFPHESKTIAKDCIEQILTSPLAKQMSFLQELKVAAAQKGDNVFSLTAFKKHFLDVVSASKSTPDLQKLFQSVQSQSHDFFSTGMQLSHFLLLLTACCKQELSSAECQLIYQQMNEYTKRFQIKHLGTQQWKQAKQNCIPLQLYSDFLTTFMQHTNFENLLQWEPQTNNESLQCFLLIFGELAEQAFSQPRTALEKYEWSKLLKNVFDVVFKSAQTKFDFLINFYVYEQLPKMTDYAVLRVRALKLTNALLKNSENKLTIDSSHILKMTIALIAETEVVRHLALETLTLSKDRLREHLKYFVEDVLDCSHEIGMDHEQYPLILYTTLKSSKQAGEKILNCLLTTLTATDALQQQPIYIAALLKTLKHVNDEQLLTQLVPLGMAALMQHQLDDSSVRMLLPPYSSIYQSVLERCDAQTIENALLDDELVWQFIERSFQQHDVYLQWEQKLQTVPCFVLQTLDSITYKHLPEHLRHGLILLIVQTIAQSRNDTLFLVANKFLKKCDIDCTPLVKLLEQMIAVQVEDSTKSTVKRKTPTKPESTPATLVHTSAWQQGIVVLELLEGKRRVQHMQLLIPSLFELLKYCLAVEEQAAVEYTKQLTLSALLHACQKSQEHGISLPDVLPKTTFRIDQIVQCLRTTQNPQTHNNALLLLSHCASLYPQQVLHNIVDIFTFMGSSVVRHDDAFSFHIINNIIESIVPILVQGKGDATQVIPVLKVFSDIMLDVPEHRRLPLYTKLLQTLGAERYLWNFLCVVFEALVIDEEKQRLLQKQKSTPSSVAEKLPKRLEIVLDLSNSFEPAVVLQSCIQLLQYLKTLQVSIEPTTKTTRKQLSTNVDAAEMSLFDVQTHTAKQLRHFKYVIMQYLSSVSNAPALLHKIAQLDEAELLALKPLYQEFIIKILSYVPVLNTAIEQCAEQSHTKFWKVLLHHVHDLLDNAISLLSPDMFLLVVTGLMQHQVLSIRKKVIELLISKLQQRDAYFEACDDAHFRSLLQPLTDIVDGILTQPAGDTVSTGVNELVYIQQNALIAIKLLSKLFAFKYIDDFKMLLANLTKIAKRRKQIPKILLATVILALVGISSNLKAHSLAYLPKYMPHLIELLQEQSEQVRQQAPDHVCIALIASIQKLVESLPLFLGPYMVDIITALSSISSRIQAQTNQKEVRTTTALNRISVIWTKLAQDVPVRVLVPACEKSFKRLTSTQSHADISVLMQLLHTSITHADNADLSSVQSELSNFFLEALAMRQQLQLSPNTSISENNVQNIEASVIDAFVAWVLKLSESAFRPLYQRVYDWALQQQQPSPQKTNILTYFLLTNKIADALKSLFVLFAGDFIDDAARLLDECHASKVTIDADDERIHTQLLQAILSTLHNVFLHDSKKFMNSQRFEVLLQPIVDQLENRLVLEDDGLQSLLTSCLAQLAVAVSSDMLWKQLNYQVLLKTRTNVPEVRMLAFNCCVEIARKLGDDFTTLLPETVPFIAELFEDENARVEKNTRKAVQELEVILGESLQKYL